MARIRSIKPGFFKDDRLFDAEKATGLPLRVAFAGLWTVADREGRFKWQPRVIKTDVLPYDDVDFEAVLVALCEIGKVQRYRVAGKEYGLVSGFKEHQTVNMKEAASVLPPPSEGEKAPNSHAEGAPTDELLCDHMPARESMCGHSMEGKGREGKERVLSAGADQSLFATPQSVKQPQPRKAGTRKQYPADFEEFWAGYPTDANMSKAEAMAPWSKMGPDERRQAIAALPEFQAYCSENRNWYRPVHAVKFLKARRFEQFAEHQQQVAVAAETRNAMLAETERAWNGRAAALLSRIGREAFERWFLGAELIEGPPVIIRVAKDFQRDHILARYGMYLHELFGADVSVERCGDACG